MENTNGRCCLGVFKTVNMVIDVTLSYLFYSNLNETNNQDTTDAHDHMMNIYQKYCINKP